ncbi:RNA-directed DNA polymerase, eukaryota [Tanacetum coccineum]
MVVVSCRFEEFSVASVRKYIDDHKLTGSSSITRWVKAVPIKINVIAWKVRYDALPARLNLSRRGLDLQSIFCPICNKEVESSSRIFVACSLVRDIYRKIASWDGVEMMQFSKLMVNLDGVQLPMLQERWSWSLVGLGHRSNNYSESKRNDHLDNNRRQEQRNKGIPNKSHPNFREEHKSFSSIFVSNIPWNASVQDLWDICNKWGVVIDVYIAAKRSKSGHRFDFVRFINVNDICWNLLKTTKCRFCC